MLKKITCARMLAETEPEVSKPPIHRTIGGIAIREKPKDRKSKAF